MIINPTLPAESTASILTNNRGATAAPGSPNDPFHGAQSGDDLDRMRGIAQAGLDGETSSADTTAADGWTNFLGSNFLTRAGTALAAQANLNPETAFSLLQ